MQKPAVVAAINKVSSLINLYLAKHGYAISAEGDAWHYAVNGSTSGKFSTQLDVTLAAVEHYLKA